MADQIFVYNGIDGIKILSGTIDPIVGQGNDDDLFLNLTSYELFKKETGSWISKGIIKGADGADGADGSNGIDGNDGTNGTNGLSPEFQINGTNLEWRYVGGSTWTDLGTVVGADGTNGIDGQDGATGAQGDQGIQGIQGLTGAKGDDGTTGSAGADGADGDIYKTTSSTSVDLSVVAIGDSISFTVDSGLAYSAGQVIVGSNTATPAEQIVATVTSYTSTTLVVVLQNKNNLNTITSWVINLSGLSGFNSLTDYLITATAGTGTVSSRVFTVPAGWDVDSSDNITVTGLGGNAVDLTIKHDTNMYAVDVVILADDGSKYTKLLNPVSYATMYEDLTHIAIELASFCTLQQSLLIHVKLQ